MFLESIVEELMICATHIVHFNPFQLVNDDRLVAGFVRQLEVISDGESKRSRDKHHIAG